MYVIGVLALTVGYFLSYAVDSNCPLLLTIGYIILHYLEDILKELKKK